MQKSTALRDLLPSLDIAAKVLGGNYAKLLEQAEGEYYTVPGPSRPVAQPSFCSLTEEQKGVWDEGTP